MEDGFADGSRCPSAHEEISSGSVKPADDNRFVQFCFLFLDESRFCFFTRFDWGLDFIGDVTLSWFAFTYSAP